MPWPLQEAIQHGLNILGWYENFISEEIPPETIWDDSEGVEEWFKDVKRKHDAKWGKTGVDGDTGGDLDAGNSVIANDLAGFFRE